MMEPTTEVVKLRKSLTIPSVQELGKQPLINIPPRFVRSDQQPPVVSNDLSISTAPVVDLQSLIYGDLVDTELEKLDFACRTWGFFQVINHGVSTSLLEEFKLEIQNLFNLPLVEKKKLWQQPDSLQGFGQHFVLSEQQKLDWSDMFYITTLPVTLRKTDLFEMLPHKLREVIEAYSKEVKKLAMAILTQMTKALKMDVDEMRELLNDGIQSMRMNCYPPCPEPEMAIGLTPHSDPGALTILYQLNETEGLQIRKEGNWVPIKPLPNALVVNIGDTMEIVSNGVYRSIEHRATVNSMKERLSVATFHSCKLDAELGPAPSLIGPQNPALFRTVSAEKYMKDFFARKLNGKSNINFMKIENEEEK